MDFGPMRVLLEHARATGSRSTALQPLQWMLGLSLTATVSAVSFGGPVWLLVTLLAFSGLSLAVFIGSYLFLLAKDRDALRSERFALQKMAMEKGLLGDSVLGVQRAETGREVTTIQTRAAEEGGDR